MGGHRQAWPGLADVGSGEEEIGAGRRRWLQLQGEKKEVGVEEERERGTRREMCGG